MNNHQLEQLALQLSTRGALGLALLGITFGLIASSEAIMLDGLQKNCRNISSLLTL